MWKMGTFHDPWNNQNLSVGQGIIDSIDSSRFRKPMESHTEMTRPGKL